MQGVELVTGRPFLSPDTVADISQGRAGSIAHKQIFINDLIDGLVLALDRDLGFAILNLGGGKKVSVLEMISLLEKTLEVPAEIEWLPAQVGDVRRTWSDTTAAREALGFEPRVSFAEGIERFVDWLQEQP